MKLTILKPVLTKLNYFLETFPKKEWSGPGWFACKQEKDEFPEEFVLLDFHPLDLGTHSSTEWDSKTMLSVLKEKIKINPKLKKCYLGLVHSHHTMGAFFSDTDDDTLEEMAPDIGFYPSLVVATAKEKYAFAVSYKDQYQIPHLVESDDDCEILPLIKPKKDWADIAKTLKKTAKATNHWTRGNGQGIINYGHGDYGQSYGYKHFPIEKKSAKVSVNDIKSSKESYYPVLSNEEEEMVYKCFDAWENRLMSWDQVTLKLEKVGIRDPLEFFGMTYDTKEYQSYSK
tara:strand:+ start:1016 stop:1873 length:858 start_codon:yes stop_codon:yes gene_type:complete